MEKLVYGLWRSPDTDPREVQEWLLQTAAPALLAEPVHGLRILAEATEGAVMRVGAQPDGSLFTAAVSVWLDSLDERPGCEAALRAAPATAHGWLVTESVPQAYGAERSWPDGEMSPGLSIVTVFDKKDGLADEDFYRIWHGEHTPLSFDIHPLWLYVRNAVVRPVTAGAPPIRAFVYEATRTTEDMLDFFRFFGAMRDGERDKAALQTNIERVNNHMATFAKIPSLETTPMHEWIYRTFST